MEITIKTRFNIGDQALMLHYNDEGHVVSIRKCEIADIAFSFNESTKHTPVSSHGEKVLWVSYTVKHDFMEFSDVPEHHLCTNVMEVAETIEKHYGNHFKI